MAKAALYYAIFVVEEKERNNLLKEAELRIKIAEKMESENIGMLFTKRNYYEAIGDLQNAILVNNKIKKNWRDKSMSDVDSAQKVYKTYLMVDNFIEILMENEKSGANEYTFGLKSKKIMNSF